MAEEFAPAVFDLDNDEFNKTRQRMHITNDNKIHIETVTDITALAEENKEIRNDLSKSAGTGDMVRVARLPMSVYLDLSQRGILRDKSAMRRWLASEEALPYRTHWMKS